MTNESDAIRLRQGDNLKALFQKISIMEMVTVYYTSESSNHGVYCGLIPNSEVKKSLKSFSWDLSHGGGYPDATVYYNDGDEVAIYHRYGNDQGVEPLIIDRDFGGIRPDYVEINEEFRFFHQLYHDVKENKYIKINDSGLEEVVAVVESGRVKIRLKEIRQFLSIKEMHLAIQFDYRELSAMKLGQLGLSSDDNKEEYADLACWSLHFGDVPGCNSQGFSRLLGKYLIPPFPKTKSGMWGFTQEKPEQYADFVIGVDDDGENI
ncbi:hypothetical protein LJC22_06720, partial [Desulfosarcina sp. OttesenSCG-928-G10]|nr:hypothetical protein [Desulfosarcina sp. OttesenSCG-928-G10]